MAAEDERERLVGVLAELQAELCPDGALTSTPGALPTPRSSSLLDPEEEALVGELGRSLAKLAAAAASAHPPTVRLPESATLGSVGGAEWVMRAAIARGEPERLGALMPDFVYLVTLPYLERAGALAAAARYRELLERQEGIGEGGEDGGGQAGDGR